MDLYFLLERAFYLNHFYLVCLFAFLLIFMPAHRAFSVDAWLRPHLRSQIVPAWCLNALRLQMGLVYLFAGVAKLYPDWLSGAVVRSGVHQFYGLPLIGALVDPEVNLAAERRTVQLPHWVMPLRD